MNGNKVEGGGPAGTVCTHDSIYSQLPFALLSALVMYIVSAGPVEGRGDPCHYPTASFPVPFGPLFLLWPSSQHSILPTALPMQVHPHHSFVSSAVSVLLPTASKEKGCSCGCSACRLASSGLSVAQRPCL